MRSESELLEKQDEYLRAGIRNMVSFVKEKPYPRFSSFLNERERGIVQGVLSRLDCFSYLFFGGAEDCDRTMLGVFPKDWPPETDSFPIVPLCISGTGNHALSHRDYLGSLMALQIKREAIGDIVVTQTNGIVFVKSEISDYIIMNLDKIGQTPVTVSLADMTGFVKTREFKPISGTVSSFRLDCIVAFLLGKSRSAAAAVIRAGTVFLNYRETTEGSVQLKPGDTLSVRGTGKFIITQEMKKTRKDRFFITVHQLV